MIGQFCHLIRDERIGFLPSSAEQVPHDILVGLRYLGRLSKEKAREEKEKDDSSLFHGCLRRNMSERGSKKGTGRDMRLSISVVTDTSLDEPHSLANSSYR
jgi:hypothetical protein